MTLKGQKKNRYKHRKKYSKDFIETLVKYNMIEYIDCSLFKGDNAKQLNMMMKGVIINEKTED